MVLIMSSEINVHKLDSPGLAIGESLLTSFFYILAH